MPIYYGGSDASGRKFLLAARATLPMRGLTVLIIASLLLISLPAASAGSGVQKCYGTDAARACVEYAAINDICLRVNASGGILHEECVLFIGPPL